MIAPLPPVMTGLEFRQIREAFTVSAADAARLLGICAKHLQRVELGRVPMQRTLSLACHQVVVYWFKEGGA